MAPFCSLKSTLEELQVIALVQGLHQSDPEGATKRVRPWASVQKNLKYIRRMIFREALEAGGKFDVRVANGDSMLLELNLTLYQKILLQSNRKHPSKINNSMLQYNKCGQNPISMLMLANCLLLANISLSLSQQCGATEPGTFGRPRHRRGLLAERSERAKVKRFPAVVQTPPRRCLRLLRKLRYVKSRRSDDPSRHEGGVPRRPSTPGHQRESSQAVRAEWV